MPSCSFLASAVASLSAIGLASPSVTPLRHALDSDGAAVRHSETLDINAETKVFATVNGPSGGVHSPCNFRAADAARSSEGE